MGGGAAWARPGGLAGVLSCDLVTAVGLSQGAALAASLPSLEYDCGLGTASLFADDIADARPVGGSVSAERVVPDAAALARLEAPADRRAWWLERLSRCHAVLQG
jgi:O-succinylbenzoate synthase